MCNNLIWGSAWPPAEVVEVNKAAAVDTQSLIEGAISSASSSVRLTEGEFDFEFESILMELGNSFRIMWKMILKLELERHKWKYLKCFFLILREYVKGTQCEYFQIVSDTYNYVALSLLVIIML